MAAGSLAKRYALAFLEVASEDPGKMDTISNNLAQLDTLLSENDHLMQVLSNDTIPLGDRKAVVKEIAQRLSLETATLNFVSLLLDKKRINLMSDIWRIYQELSDQRQGILRGSLKTAQKIESTLHAQIQENLSRLTGKKVEMEIEEDPNLIGGMVASIGHTVFDGSVSTQLDNLKKQMTTRSS